MARTARILRKLAECKAKGICERDRIVNMYISNRVEWHKNFRNSGLQRMRLNWELDCPISCPPPPEE